MESKESMGARANSFLDDHLLPLLRSETIERQHNIAVVSHGIILSMLWRCLLKRFAARTIAFTPGLHVGSASTILEYLGGWSNTGYLELSIEKVEGLEPLPLSRRTEEGNPPPLLGSAVISEKPITHVEENSISTNAAELASPPGAIDDLQTKDASSTTDRPEILYGWKMTIRAINCKDHLKGLKRTGGGVGSSQFDEGQKKIETFFKKRKTS